MNLRRIVEIAWLAVAAVCTVEFYMEYKDNSFSQKAIILLVGLAVSLFMYSFRKRTRKKMEEYKESQKEVK